MWPPLKLPPSLPLLLLPLSLLPLLLLWGQTDSGSVAGYSEAIGKVRVNLSRPGTDIGARSGLGWPLRVLADYLKRPWAEGGPGWQAEGGPGWQAKGGPGWPWRVLTGYLDTIEGKRSGARARLVQTSHMVSVPLSEEDRDLL